MPVASELSEEDFESTVTAENEMFAAEGLDRKNLRTELSQVMDLDVFDDRYMEREERTALDPRAIDLDATPRGMQEIGGEGVEVLEIEGRRYDTFVHTDGFTVNPVTDSVDVQRQEMALRERMAFLHDAYFLTGVDGISQSPSVFDYMRNNIPAERTFDREEFDGDSGDVDLVGHEEDFFAVEAMDATDFRLIDFNEGWDTMIGGRGALTSLNAREGTDSGTAGPSYRDRLQEDNLIQNFMLLPPERRLNVAPRDSDIPRDEFPSFQLVDPDTAVNPSARKWVMMRRSSSPTWIPSVRNSGGSVSRDRQWSTSQMAVVAMNTTTTRCGTRTSSTRRASTRILRTVYTLKTYLRFTGTSKADV